MKKWLLLLFVLFITSFHSYAQSGYEIKIDLKNYKEDLAYLTYYQFDKTLIKDTCATVQNGKIRFKGSTKLNTGVYALVSKQKTILFNFFVDESTQKLELRSDAAVDFAEDVFAVNSDRQNDFLNYIKYFGAQNNAFLELKKNTILNTKEDSLVFNKKQKEIEMKSADYEEKFLNKNKGTYIASVLNLKKDKFLKEIPLASNCRPDSIKAFNYYKKHYWDEVDFSDDAVMRNPFFYNKLKKYFDQVVPIHPDSICVEIDKILAQTNTDSMLYKSMLVYFINTYEVSDIMGFDKVFVYLSDTYFKTGKALGVYEYEGVVQRIINRAEAIRPLLIGSKAPDLSMIKAEDFNKMKALGFESVTSSEEMTKLYYENLSEISKMYVKLNDVKAKYTVLVFWDVDCSHCEEEIPVLLKGYKNLLNANIDVKVYSVYMQHEGEKYLKFIAEHQLPWINVYDGARINNTSLKYDVNTTPIIYILDKNKVIKAKRISAKKVNEIIKSFELQN